MDEPLLKMPEAKAIAVHWETIRNQLHTGWMVACLSHAEQEAENAEAQRTRGKGTQHLCCRPPPHGQCIADLAAQPVSNLPETPFISVYASMNAETM